MGSILPARQLLASLFPDSGDLPIMEIGIPILMQLQKALLRCKNPAWKTLIPSLPTWTLLLPPVQIHQLATFLWNILNNDRDANMAILERLEDTYDDLSRHPVQIFSAADLAHLASHLAESTRTLSEQARRMEAFPDEAL